MNLLTSVSLEIMRKPMVFWMVRSSRPKSPEACNFIKKETLAQVFSCEFFEISKNTFFYRTPPVSTSDDFREIRI